MSETLAATVKLTVNATLTGDADLGNRVYNLPFSKTHSLTHGAGLNQANTVWSDTREIAASTTEDLDLYGGLTSALGTTLNFTRIKFIMISAATTNVNNVLIGGDAAGLAGWTGALNDLLVLRPGGMFALSAPDATAYAVTQTTGDILQIANSSSGSSVFYDIIIIGTI